MVWVFLWKIFPQHLLHESPTPIFTLLLLKAVTAQDDVMAAKVLLILKPSILQYVFHLDVQDLLVWTCVLHCFLAFSKEHCSPLCTLLSFLEFICNICLTSSIVQLVLFYSSNSLYIKDKQVVSMFSIFCMILFSSSIESIVKM